jgi:hypothetical protein
MKFAFTLIACLLFINASAISPSSEKVLHHAFNLFQKKNYESAIEICTVMIDSKYISNVDKLHFYVARANYYYFSYEPIKGKRDQELMMELIFSDPECMNEYMLYYRD